MNCQTWPLSGIDLAELTLVKERVRWSGQDDHSRWVFRMPRSARGAGGKDLYLKIWNPTYIRRDHVLQALDAGFYDERTTPALHGLVVHRGISRGYVMERGRRSRRIAPAFREVVKETTARTGYFHVNFGPHHVVRHAGWCSLIDLDGVYPLHELTRMPLDPCAFDSPDYERFVCGLVAGATSSRVCGHAIRPPAVDGLRRLARFPLDKVRALYGAVGQGITTRRPTAAHLDLIERG